MKFDMNSNWLPGEQETEDGGIIIDLEADIVNAGCFARNGISLDFDTLLINGKEVVSISPEY